MLRKQAKLVSGKGRCAAPGCHRGLKALFIRKLGRCSWCMGLSTLGALAGWALVALVRVLWPQPLVLVIALAVAVSFTILLVSHLTVFTIRRATSVVSRSGEGKALERREFMGTLVKVGAAALAVPLFGGIGGKTRGVSASPVGDAEGPTLTNMWHELEFQIKGHTFSSHTSFSDEVNTLRISDETGAVFDSRFTATEMEFTQADSMGKQLGLVLKSVMGELQGKLQIGPFLLTASGPEDEVLADLTDQAERISDINKHLPDVSRLLLAVGALNQQERFKEYIFGLRLAGSDERLCEALCKCCEKGGLINISICCFACAICGIGRIRLTL